MAFAPPDPVTTELQLQTPEGLFMIPKMSKMIGIKVANVSPSFNGSGEYVLLR